MIVLARWNEKKNCTAYFRGFGTWVQIESPYLDDALCFDTEEEAQKCVRAYPACSFGYFVMLLGRKGDAA